MPFTVTFFRDIISLLDTNSKLFTVAKLHDVHEFFLPIFVLTLELISIQVSIGIWRVRDLQTKLALIVMLAFFQLIPTFSTYFSARLTEFAHLQANQPVEVPPAELVVAKSQRHELEVKYEADVKANDREYTTWTQTRSSLETQIRNQQMAIERNANAVQDALRQARLASTGAERQAWLSEASRLAAIGDGLNEQLVALNTKLKDVLAVEPKNKILDLPVFIQPDAKPKPLLSSSGNPYRSNMEFLVDTFNSPTSHMGMLAAAIFPALVIGAGYVLSRSRDDRLDAAHVSVDSRLGELLTYCSSLPRSMQDAFATYISSEIIFYLSEVKARQSHAVSVTNSFQVGEYQLEFVKVLDQLKGMVQDSEVIREVKDKLSEVINNNIKWDTNSAAGEQKA